MVAALILQAEPLRRHPVGVALRLSKAYIRTDTLVWHPLGSLAARHIINGTVRWPRVDRRPLGTPSSDRRKLGPVWER